MRFAEFEQIMSPPRLSRYLTATGNASKKAMTLYRKNLRLSQELFTVISCFEIALRNKIDRIYGPIHGNHWLRDSVTPGGMYDTPRCRQTKRIIEKVFGTIQHHYTHPKLVAEMDFGFWRHQFANPQFKAAGSVLLRVFPGKPPTTPTVNYNHTFVFNQLEQINNLRNRIAHHEPICFLNGQPVKNTTYARQHYNLILQLFQWMGIDEAALLYGLDHIVTVCNEIDAL